MRTIIQVQPVECQQINMLAVSGKTCDNQQMSKIEEKYKQQGQRIRATREAAGYTQAQMATALDIAQQSYADWESGKTENPKKIYKFASLAGVTVDYIMTGKEELEGLPYILAPRCPLIPWDAAIEWPYNFSELKESKKIEYPANKVVLHGKCYMLKIEDNSMVNFLEGGKGFHPEKYIIVDPDRKYKSDDFVVAYKQNFLKLIFRKYTESPTGIYLKPLNISDEERIPITPEIKIVGVVVAYLDILV